MRTCGRVVASIVAVVIAGLVGSGCTSSLQDERSSTAPSPAATSSDVASPPSPAPPSPAADTQAADAATGFVVWGRGGLHPSVAVAAGALDGVTAAAVVPSDTLRLTGSRRADGTPVDEFPDGFGIAVDVAAVDPDSYRATVDDPDVAAALAELSPGGVLMTRAAAARRDLGAGDRLDLAGRPDLEIVALVPDGAFGRAELAIHPVDGPAAGLPTEGTLFVESELEPGPRREALATALGALVPPDVTARVVDLVGDDRDRRRAPLVLSLAQVKDRFGEFAYRPLEGQRGVEIDPAWVDEHIVAAAVPLLGTVTCHRGIVEALRAALAAVEAAGAADQIDPGRFAGCFNARRIQVDGTRLSRHAWGIALDVNVDLSLPGGGEVPSDDVIDAFESNGFVWGGRYLVPDNHHFEFVGDDVRIGD